MDKLYALLSIPGRNRIESQLYLGADLNFECKGSCQKDLEGEGGYGINNHQPPDA